MNAYLSEFLGTAILIIFGNGVVANVVLAKTKGNGSGWIVITAGWAFAVFIGAFCTAAYSGAHLNPAITIAMVSAGKLAPALAPGYIIAQVFGGLVGAVLVYVFYREHFKISDDPDGKLACFCTAPNIRNTAQSVFCEIFGTFLLVLPIFLMTDTTINWPSAEGTTPTVATVGLGSIGLIPVALLVFGIGLSLGGTTGYAINPARDLGPRIAHFLLPIPGKRDSDWGYAWVPVVAPIIGGLLAALVSGLLKQS